MACTIHPDGCPVPFDSPLHSITGEVPVARALRSLSGTAPGEVMEPPEPELHGRGRCYGCPAAWEATGAAYVARMVTMGRLHQDHTGHVVHLETIEGGSFSVASAAAETAWEKQT